MLKIASTDLRKVAMTFLLYVNWGLAGMAAPIINSFTPASGPIGTTVTIIGSNFNTTAGNNIVFFGAVKATVSTATATTLTVAVPAGATYQPISVTDLTTKLSGYSAKPFITTFAGAAGIDAGSFASQTDFETNDTPFCVTVADLDGDGKADLEVVNYGSDNISIFRNTSTGGVITFDTEIHLLTGTSPISAAIGDLDGDGKPEIAVANYGTSTVSVFHNNSSAGTISFSLKKDLTANSNPRCVAIGDLDGDGKPELVTSNYGKNTISILQNTSTAGVMTFSPEVDITVGTNPYCVAIGDIDGDGKPDLSVANGNSNSISILHNKSTIGTISYDAKVDFITGTSPVNIAIGDVDGDGKTDIVVSNNLSNTISIFHNKSTIGAISLDSKLDFTTGTSPISISLADLDGDNKLDIAVANYSSSNISVFHNTSASGLISLTDKYDFTIGTSSRSVGIGDLDNDGKPDISIAYEYSSVAVIKNIGSLPTISSFTPNIASIGTNVIITGTNLTGTSQVTFGGIAAESFKVISSTSISAVVGNGSTGSLSVSMPRGTASMTGFNFIPNGAPLITSFTPNSAISGETIVITGKNFANVSSVTIGGVSVSSYNVVSSSTITAVVASGSSGNVIVTATAGTGTLGGFTFKILPAITSFAPASGAVGTTVIISGSNFNTIAANNIVFFGATKAVVNTVTSTSISVVVPFGATYQPISVTDLITGYTIYTAKPFVTTFTGGSAFDQGTFYDTKNLTTGTKPFSVSISDLDGDGKSDIIVIDYILHDINIFRNTSSNGIVSFDAKTSIDIHYHPSNAVCGDIDGDGKPDIAVANFGSNSISVFRNTSVIGAITFSTGIDYQTNSSPRNIVLGDLDGNGKPELVVSNFSFGSVSIFKNISSIGYISFVKSQNLTTGDGPFGVSLNDIDGDGKPEILTTNYNSSTFSVFLNTSNQFNISFAAKKDFDTGANPVCIPVADLDGDGKPDITVVGFGTSTISIFRNKSTLGTILFDSKVDYNTGASPYGLSYGDLDGDGKLDLVVANSAATNISVFRNTSNSGTISMDAAVNYAVNKPINVAIGDLDGDGRPDIAASSDDNIVAIIRNTNIPPVISSFTPATGTLGTTVTINGSNLIGTTSVSFGGTPATAVTVVSSTKITAVVNLGTSGDVTIINSRGTYSAPGFTYTIPKPPTITSFTPTSVGNGFSVVITGTDFFGASAVSFGGTPATSINVNSTTSITAIVATGTSGNVSVTTPGGNALLAGFVFRLPPTLTSFTPAICKSGTSVVLTGTLFTDATDVKFGGVSAVSFEVLSPTSISAVSPVGPSGSISVSTPGGTVSLAGYSIIPAPTITSFSPTFGKTGSTITITGTNFSGATAISFGGIPAQSFTVVSPTSITAVVDAGTTGAISITAPGGTVTIPGFTYYPTPVILSFTPTSVGNGFSVVITGTGLAGASAVSFGGTAATSFIVNSSTKITAIVASGTSGNVSVTTPGGTGSHTGFIFLLPPTLTSFTPNTCKAGTSIVLTGSLFTGATDVKFGGVSAVSFTVDSPTSITAITPVGPSGNISVSTMGGTVSLPGYIIIPAPVITSFTPTFGKAGTNVTITGFNFSGATEVSFGGTPAQSFTVVSSTSITAVVNAGTSGVISITTPGGSVTMGDFKFYSNPEITSFTPTSTGSGFSVIIYGNNLEGTSFVTFGGTPAISFIVNSSTHITAIVASGTSGDVSVTTPGGTSILEGFTFIMAPIITSFTPESGISGTVVTITGSNFDGATEVKFGGVSAVSFTLDSPISITAICPVGPSGSVSVSTPGGTVSLPGYNFIPAPSITSINPPFGIPGSIITLTGTDFSGTTAVSFGGTPAQSYNVVSATSITAVVDAGTSGDINVTTIGGTGSISGFTIINAPAISSFTPTSGFEGSLVSIVGTNLTYATKVTIGGIAASSFTVISATNITAIVAKGSTGDISVTTMGGTATLAGYSFLRTPKISSFTPATGSKGINVVIKGIAFTGTSQVSFGSSLATTFTVVSDTIINATVPGESSGDVSVITPGGKASLAGFKFLDTGLKDILEAGIIIYPNPVVDYLYITSFNNNIIDFQIIDVNGHIVLKSKIVNQKLDLQNLKSGMYTLKIGNSIYKFIKQ